MRNPSSRWTIGALTVTALVFLTLHTAGQAPRLREPFDIPDPPGWVLHDGAMVEGGILYVPSDAFAAWQIDLADGALAIRLRLLGDGELVVGYAVSEAGRYTLALHREFLTLQREADGVVRELAGGPPGIMTKQWTELVIHVQGGTHAVAIDGQSRLTALDPTPLPAGGVTLQARGGAAGEFDDVLQQTVDAGAPGIPTPPQTPADAPAYESTTWVRLGGPPGGLGYDIRMRPDRPDEMYVTDARAGIFKSTDGGMTWYATNSSTMAFGPEEMIPIFCATIDPHDYNVVWVGTQVSGHLYRTPDGGEHWEARDTGIPHDGRSLRGITIDPNDPHVVYVGLEVDVGVWQREHPEASAEVAGGEVYKSTDTGLTWTRIWQGPNVARYVWIDPRNSNRVYVSTGIFDRIPANSDFAAGDRGGVGVLRSDDGGQTWTALDERNGLGGRVIPSLYMHPTDPDTLIAAVYGANEGSGVFATYDGGDTWQQMLVYTTGMHNVEIAESNPDIWYAATEDRAFRSDDAGRTWQQYVLATPDHGAGMPIDLQVDPRDPYRVFVNNYGGSNFVSTDGGATWVDASSGYTGASIGVFVLPDDAVLAEANTGVFRSTDGGETWLGLTVTETPPPPREPAQHLVLGAAGDVLHSTDGGVTWSRIRFINLLAEVEAGRIGNDVLASRIAVAPSDPQTMYLTFHDGLCATASDEACLIAMPGFFRSTDGGYTWEKRVGGPFERVSTRRIVVHPHDARRLFAATGEGLYRSDDGGDSWQLVSALSDAAAQITIWDTDSYLSRSDAVIATEVAFDPANPDILYAAILQKGVFRSDDGGATWRTAAYGMDPNEPIMALVADPDRPGVLYAASKWSGVFVSMDHAQTWQLIDDGFDNTPISLALSTDGSTLYAGSFSGGTWRLGPGVPAR
ncbi:MAG: hypothetical protein IPM16_12650 [Chloroflexi bacterium]|nr:hypothetical protein [Chloroflexota bacterium]